jgi:hypothetical protein
MKIEDVRRRLRESCRHLQFCVVLYNKQLARGKHFLHEHPQGASSWREGYIERLANQDGVKTTVGHLCQYGMVIIDDSGTSRPIMKPTRWLSSSVPMLRRLSAKCQNEHTHGSLLNGKAAGAAIYLQMLCVEILKGIRDTTIEEDMKKEMEDENQDQHMIGSLLMEPRSGDLSAPKGIIANINKSQWENVQKYFDEMTHIELPAKLVREARAEELECFNTPPVWDVVKTQECWDVTGSPPITTKWVDVNTGDQQDYDIRCRLVAREMGGAKSDEFYAPTPPLEARRVLFSEAATNRRFGKYEKKLLFVYVRKAYFNAVVDRSPTI